MATAEIAKDGKFMKYYGKIVKYSAKAFYASPTDLAARIPELEPLRDKKVAVFGLGCLGAPSVLEFAKSGVRRIDMVDYDIVDPATVVRWPIGFMAAGKRKVDALHEFIKYNYPYTKTEAFSFKVGAIRYDPEQKSQQECIKQAFAGADLIYDCTAEEGVHQFLSDMAWSEKKPYVIVAGTLGGWGGKVIRLRPYQGTGCWHCYEKACEDGIINDPPIASMDESTIQPVGCADPTFTAAGFDMLQVALTGVRMAVTTLCEGRENAYPASEEDVVHIRLRKDDGTFCQPVFESHMLSPLSDCRRCNGKPQ